MTAAVLIDFFLVACRAALRLSLIYIVGWNKKKKKNHTIYGCSLRTRRGQGALKCIFPRIYRIIIYRPDVNIVNPTV